MFLFLCVGVEDFSLREKDNWQNKELLDAS